MEQNYAQIADQVQGLMASKNDTQRIVGLNVLINVLERFPDFLDDHERMEAIWFSIPTKFFTRLMKTGCNPKAENGQQYLTLAISVMHRFSQLIPGAGKLESFTMLIPLIVSSLLYTSPEVTESALDLLENLVKEPPSVVEFSCIEDKTSLTEAAPRNEKAMSVLIAAWLCDTNLHGGRYIGGEKIDEINAIMESLVASFQGTDATTLLLKMGPFLQWADAVGFPLAETMPPWAARMIDYVHKLCTHRPTPLATTAYTNAANALLTTWKDEASNRLFSGKRPSNDTRSPSGAQAPGVLLINLITADIRASAPLLLEKRSDPEYDDLEKRVSQAYKILSSFIAWLVRISEDEEKVLEVISFDHLMSIQQTVRQTMRLTIEFIRDKWEQDKEAGRDVCQDTLSSFAILALSLWIHDEEDQDLRKESRCLEEILREAYEASMTEWKTFGTSRGDGETGPMDWRVAILNFLEPWVEENSTHSSLSWFHSQGWWKMLLDDLRLSGRALVERDPNGEPPRPSHHYQIVRVLTLAMDVDFLVDNWDDMRPTVREFTNIPELAREGDILACKDDDYILWETHVGDFFHTIQQEGTVKAKSMGAEEKGEDILATTRAFYNATQNPPLDVPEHLLSREDDE